MNNIPKVSLTQRKSPLFVCLIDADIPENFTTASLNHLHRLLTKLAAKFEELGIQLGLELAEIDALSYKKVDMGQNLHRMLDYWKDKGNWSDGKEPLSLIFTALESKSIKRQAIANELRKKWKDCYCKL